MTEKRRNIKGRKQREKSKKQIIRGVLLTAAALILSGGGIYEWRDSFFGSAVSVHEQTQTSGEMEVTFLDVGQGDCTIVFAGEQCMVVDCGDNREGDTVVEWLWENEVQKIDYLVLTHPDADHIGGADNILRAFEVERVIMPDVGNDTQTYWEVEELLEEEQIPVEFPEVGAQYTLGDAAFTILCPDENIVNSEDTNSYSVGIKLVHGKKSFVMCGDAEQESEQAMVAAFGDRLEADVLKCGHHGSNKATSRLFLKAVDPVWAVISCGKDNSYGHPHAGVLERLEDEDVQVYRTDRSETITAVSDGKSIRWEFESVD